MVRVSVLCYLVLLCAVHTARAAATAANDYVNDEDYDYDEEEETPPGGEESSAPTGPPPVIVSEPAAVTAKPGDTVFLQCDIRNLSPTYAVMWLNGSAPLYSDNFKLLENPRVDRFLNHTLRISDVRLEDSGNFSCKISSNPPVEVVHKLLVLSPAQIVKLLPDGDHRTLLLGSALTLECTAVGHPEPQVTWTKPGSLMPGGKQEVRHSVVNIAAVTVEDAGSYECVASNGMGGDVVRKLTIHVHYGPKISVMKPVVNSGLGYESELQCKVEAMPAATVTWAKNGKPLSSGGHVKVETLPDNLHTLRITKTRKEDFATYSCVANNTISSETATIQLTGTPSIAKFLTSNSTGNSATFQWVIESHAPITEYTLRYRIKKTNEWRTENPIVEDPIGNQYRVTHTLTNLAPGDYEVQLSSKNSYGLSKESSPHFFNIKDYGEAAQSKVEATSSPNNNAVDTRPVAALLTSLLCISAYLQ